MKGKPEHEFTNGATVRAMYDGFDRMYKKGDTATVLSSQWGNTLALTIKTSNGRKLTVYADNWEVITP